MTIGHGPVGAPQEAVAREEVVREGAGFAEAQELLDDQRLFFAAGQAPSLEHRAVRILRKATEKML